MTFTKVLRDKLIRLIVELNTYNRVIYRKYMSAVIGQMIDKMRYYNYVDVRASVFKLGPLVLDQSLEITRRLF